MTEVRGFIALGIVDKPGDVSIYQQHRFKEPARRCISGLGYLCDNLESASDRIVGILDSAGLPDGYVVCVRDQRSSNFVQSERPLKRRELGPIVAEVKRQRPQFSFVY